jgi:hypothetical protein
MEERKAMSSRARLVQSVVVVASIALGTSACKHTKLDSGVQGLAVVFKPDPTPMDRLNPPGVFEQGKFDIVKFQALPVDPEAAAIYGGASLILKLDRVTEDLTKGTVPFSEIALPAGTYRVTRLEITHPNFIDENIPQPVPTDPAHCMAGVTAVNAENVGASQRVVFGDPPDGGGEHITFTVSPGQSSMAITLNVPAFTKAYEAAFTCQVGCGTNDPNNNCLVPPFNEAAFKANVLANLTIQ